MIGRLNHVAIATKDIKKAAAVYRDTLGAKVAVDAVPHRLYSVFRTEEGERAVVVVNQNPAKCLTATVELPKPHRLLVVTPEQPEGKPTTGTLEIPPRSAAVIIEQTNFVTHSEKVQRGLRG